jgi:hypothetical protein
MKNYDALPLNEKEAAQVPAQNQTQACNAMESTTLAPSVSKHVAPMPLKYQARRLPQEGISTAFQQSMHNQSVIIGTDPTKPVVSLSELGADNPLLSTSVTSASTFLRVPGDNPFFVGGLEARLEANGYERVASRGSNEMEKKQKVSCNFMINILCINIFIYNYNYLGSIDHRWIICTHICPPADSR